MSMLQSIRRRGLGIGVLVVLTGVALFFWMQPYAIADWIKLYGYSAPSEVISLANDTTMTDKAKRLLFVNHSSIEEKAAFSQHCPRADEKTIVIGCYLSNQKGIFVLSVKDERLAGVEQVTTAHEMLHAAYDRLSGSEKKRVNALLLDYQQKSLKDQRILSALESYKKTEPGQELNEMHSMFGTEIRELPSELEKYYAQYFANRQAVVDFADKYQDAFTSRENALADYDSQLKEREEQINANTRQLDRQSKQIEVDRERLDALRDEENITAYNSSVPGFNAKVAAYNALLDETKNLITKYNALVEERNSIAAQTSELQKAIDSSILPDSQ